MGVCNEKVNNKVGWRSGCSMEMYRRWARRGVRLRKVWVVQDNSELTFRTIGRATLINRSRKGEHLEMCGGLRKRHRNEHVSVRRNGLGENADSGMSWRES